MKKSLILFAVLLFSSNCLLAQRIIRSSIGSFGSSNIGTYSIVSGSPVASPITQTAEKSAWATIQTRPFVHLESISTRNVIVVDIYPNPTSDIIHIKTSEEYSLVTITDIFGKTCYTGMATEISMSNLAAGSYTINLALLEKGIYSKKLILIK